MPKSRSKAQITLGGRADYDHPNGGSHRGLSESMGVMMGEGYGLILRSSFGHDHRFGHQLLGVGFFLSVRLRTIWARRGFFYKVKLGCLTN